MEYTEIETNLYINDVEIPCTFSFDYQPPEDSYFNNASGQGNAPVSEEITITAALIEPKTGVVCDLFTKAYDWLLTDEVTTALEEDALHEISGQTNAAHESRLDQHIEAARMAA